MIWSERATAEVRRMWTDGLSAAQIGRELGCSRNCVIGKVHRLGLPRRRNSGWTGGVKPKRKPRAPRVIRLKPVVVYQPPPAPPEEPASLDLTLMQLEAGQCRWATNDGGPFLFCGHEVAPGKPYCLHHFGRSIAGNAEPRAEPGRWTAWSRAA